MLQIVAQCVRALAHHVLGEDFDRDIVASMMDATENHGFYYRLVQVRCSGLVLFMAWFNAPSLYILGVTCYHHHMDWCMVRNNARIFLEALAFVLTLRVRSVPVWYKFASVQCCTLYLQGGRCLRATICIHACIHPYGTCACPVWVGVAARVSVRVDTRTCPPMDVLTTERTRVCLGC